MREIEGGRNGGRKRESKGREERIINTIPAQYKHKDCLYFLFK